MRRYLIGLLSVAVAAACAEDASPPPTTSTELGSPGPAVSWGDLPDVEPVEAHVFRRTLVPEAGPGRLMLHVLVGPGATEEQVRQALTDILTRTAEEDTTLLAVRAVAYVLPPVRSGEVELTPTAWGEWVPPQGWDGATPESRRQFHRIYTYYRTAPPW
ncbi:MAG: hypothetical protein DIU52_000020 [bacterium]|nr:MAG: hypothetical protein DIU52_06740 [bacterium]